MVTIYKKSEKEIEGTGEAFTHAKTLLRPSNLVRGQAKRENQKLKQAKVRQAKAAKKAKLKALSKQRELQRYMAGRVMSLGAISAKNAFQILKHCPREELLELRRIAEEKIKHLPERKRDSITKVLNQIGKVESFYQSLELEQVHRDTAKINGAISRRLTAKVVNEHRLGRVIGRVKVVEYGSPGSSTWATARKRR
ncbi:MAG: hypothetical protein H7A06_10610 [Pseudomonadales bacterium]|nr:hypothetical protein [Pseudomonadales bacterium]